VQGPGDHAYRTHCRPSLDELRSPLETAELAPCVLEVDRPLGLDQGTELGFGRDPAAIGQHGTETAGIVEPDVALEILFVPDLDRMRGEHLAESGEVDVLVVDQHAVIVEQGDGKHGRGIMGEVDRAALAKLSAFLH
jgi:hypothetical protein